MKRYARGAGALVSVGVLSWVVVSNGPAQAGSSDEHGGNGDPGGNGDHGGTTIPDTDPREGSQLFLPDGTEGPPGSKFRVGGRDCVEDYPTVALVSVVHENGTRIDMPRGVTDAEGNWEMTAVIPEDMEDGDLSIEAGCFADFHAAGLHGFAQGAPIFSYAGASFGVRTPPVPEDTTTTQPDGQDDQDGEDGGDGDDGTDGGPDGTSSGSQTSGPAPAVSGDADFTG